MRDAPGVPKADQTAPVSERGAAIEARLALRIPARLAVRGTISAILILGVVYGWGDDRAKRFVPMIG